MPPPSLPFLGLPPEYFNPYSPKRRHEAYDLGAKELFDELQIQLTDLSCSFLSAHVSRLVVDLNRKPLHAITTHMPELKVPIPENNISEQQLQQRIEQFHTPYFDALENLVRVTKAKNNAAIVIAIHSFTPHWMNKKRNLHIGTVACEETPIAEVLDPYMDTLCQKIGLLFKPNEPYNVQSIEHEEKHASYKISREYGVYYQELECRNDLLEEPKKRKEILNIIEQSLRHLHESFKDRPQHYLRLIN